MQRRFEPALVIVGRKGWLNAPIFEELRNQGLAQHVYLTGYVSDADLLVLYNMARLLVFPSLYEGFGLPCVEAMACGCPVVTSNRGALLEVTADCAVHCDPEDVTDIAEAIWRAQTDDGLREKLAANGFRRAASFSWTRYAEQFLEILGRHIGGERLTTPSNDVRLAPLNKTVSIPRQSRGL
jgi:glycosyltransferase involved in cell wall biosynthesis